MLSKLFERLIDDMSQLLMKIQNWISWILTNINRSLHSLTKIQNDHDLLDFYISENCKILNDSQLHRV